MRTWRKAKATLVASSSRAASPSSRKAKQTKRSALALSILWCLLRMERFSRQVSYNIFVSNRKRQKEKSFMPQAKIGVIGGSGLYGMEGMTDIEEVAVQTPFGDPGDVITVGKVEGVSMAFLPRHGRGHRISPGEIP